jgi:epoxyqueuosine reductase QueG
VDCVGVARLEDWKETPLWNGAARLLPGAKSVIFLAQEVFPEVVRHLSPQVLVGEAGLRDLYDRDAEVIIGHLNWEAYKAVKRLHAAGFRGLPLPSGGPYDGRLLTSPISYKHAAQAAGLGRLGWNSLLLTPEYGPRVKLVGVLTDAALPPTTHTDAELACVRCRGACAKICPAGAIREPAEGEQFRVDKHACNSFLVAVGTCAECIRVCPAGKGP